jgi:hypothetical protein
MPLTRRYCYVMDFISLRKPYVRKSIKLFHEYIVIPTK